MKEFTTTKEEVDNSKEGAISKDLLEIAQNYVEEMDADITKMKQDFTRIKQKLHEKIAYKKASASGSRMSHK